MALAPGKLPESVRSDSMMHVLEAEMIASAGGWEVEREEKIVRENFKFFGLSDCKGGIDFF